MPKRYYWLKMPEGFFDDTRIQVLLSGPDGAHCLIVYLQILLRAIHSEGVIPYVGAEESIEAELAKALREKKRWVKKTIECALKCHLAEKKEDGALLFVQANEFTGSECSSAERVRKKRENDKQNKEALHCNGEKEKEIELEIEKKKKENNYYYHNNYKKKQKEKPVSSFTVSSDVDRSGDDDSELYFRNKKLNKEDAS